MILKSQRQAATRFTYPGGMEGWVDLGVGGGLAHGCRDIRLWSTGYAEINNRQKWVKEYFTHSSSTSLLHVVWMNKYTYLLAN